MKEQIPLLLGVLPMRFISSIVPDALKVLRTIDFAPVGKIAPDGIFHHTAQPGRICRARQELPIAPGK
jgi:hypothetical protein